MKSKRILNDDAFERQEIKRLLRQLKKADRIPLFRGITSPVFTKEVKCAFMSIEDFCNVQPMNTTSSVNYNEII